MAKSFDNLRKRMSPERQQRIKAETNQMLLEMTLQELRQGIGGLSQKDVAEMLEVTQGYVSRLERQDDMLLSRLYAYVEAMGGEVEILAKFPKQEVRIKQFRELDKLTAAVTVGKAKSA